MKILRVKTWLSSFTEPSMKKKKNMAMVNIEIWIFWRELELRTTYSSAFFNTGCFLWPFQGRSCFPCISSNKQVLFLPMLPATVYWFAFCYSNCSLPKILSIHHITHATSMQTLRTPSSGQPDLTLLSLFLNCVWQVAAGWGQFTMATGHEKSKIITFFSQTKRNLA